MAFIWCQIQIYSFNFEKENNPKPEKVFLETLIECYLTGYWSEQNLEEKRYTCLKKSV